MPGGASVSGGLYSSRWKGSARNSRLLVHHPWGAEQRLELKWPLFCLSDPNPMMGSPGNLSPPLSRSIRKC